MVRFLIIGVVLAVAFTLYSLVDAAMTDAARARGVSKPVWVVLTIVLPVIGGILWFTIGKGAQPEPKPSPPDDDPRFTKITSREFDSRIDDLEQQLRDLDNEVFPGEQTQQGAADPKPRQPGPDDGPDAPDDSGSGR